MPHPLTIPIRQQYFHGYSYLEYALYICQDAFWPWWWSGPVTIRGSTRKANVLLDRQWYYGLNWPWNRRPSRCRRAVNWIFYFLRLVPMVLLASYKLVVGPLLYPSYYLLYRELIHLPQQRRRLQRVRKEGFHVDSATIRYSQSSRGVKAIGFHSSTASLPDPLQKLVADRNKRQTPPRGSTGENDCTTYFFEYEFCNDPIESRVLLDKHLDDLSIGDEFPIVVLPCLASSDPLIVVLLLLLDFSLSRWRHGWSSTCPFVFCHWEMKGWIGRHLYHFGNSCTWHLGTAISLWLWPSPFGQTSNPYRIGSTFFWSAVARTQTEMCEQSQHRPIDLVTER